MSAAEAPLVVLCTAPDEATATRLARGLVEARLAACVSALGPVRSTYRWRGAVEEAQEVQLLAKTTAARLDALVAWIRAHHPYEVPEVLALPAAGGLAAYLAWVATETTDAAADG